MNQHSTASTATSPVNGSAAPVDLFALTDEQILEIAPEGQDVEVSGVVQSESASEPQAIAPDPATRAVEAGPFAAPEEVRALAELYPGGLSQAKTAAERARTLDEIDAAYFGTAGNSAEQVSASRAQLAERMLRDDPAAFREMVFAGLRALEEAGATRGSAAGTKTVAQAFRPEGFLIAGSSPAGDGKSLTPEGVSYSNGNASPIETQAAAYATFERAANAELERSVGGAIERTIAQALPNLGKGEGEASAGARERVSGFVLANPESTRTPLRERLASSVRQDVETALKGDRQLGEQIAQILAARRFDDTARAQVVRLIGERAQQLVPGAARRVINEWTSTTLAAHGAKSERSVASAAKREVATASAPSPNRGGTTSREASRTTDQAPTGARRGVDYRKLSDEQILDL